MTTQQIPAGKLNGVVTRLRAMFAAESAEQMADQELLERFVSQRDESAFTALVLRHGPMALGVCQRVLQNPHDAEDACQAAFLVLARKAASIRKKDSLTSWLHGVAYRVAANLRKKIARRRAHEGKLFDESAAAGDDASWRDVKAILDEELQRLPEHFRAPLLLCHLEGKTRDEAAEQLGWSVATLRGRLERGRQLLGNRLTRRGVALSASLLGVLLAQHAAVAGLPPMLVVETVKAALLNSAGQVAAGLVSAHVSSLADSVVKSMWVAKLKMAMILVLVVGAGLGVLGIRIMVTEPNGNAAEVGAQRNNDLDAAPIQNKEFVDGGKKAQAKSDDPDPLALRAEKDHGHEPVKNQHGKRFHGILKSVSSVHNTLSLTTKDHGHDVTRSYALTRDTRVVVSGKDAQVEALRTGMAVDVVLTTDEKAVAEIKILHD